MKNNEILDFFNDNKDLIMLKKVFQEILMLESNKYNPLKSPKELVLSLIIFSLNELADPSKTRNSLIKTAADLLVSLSKEEDQYIIFLAYVEAYKNDSYYLNELNEKARNFKRKKNYKRGLLQPNDKLITKEIAASIAFEYLWLAPGQQPDLEMIRVYYNFLITILEKETFKKTAPPSMIDIYIDTNHEIINWNVTEFQVGSLTPNSRLFLNTHHDDILENELEKLKHKFGFISIDSLKELASAVSLEMSITKSKDSLSYRGLAMSYFSVIESESKDIINHLTKIKHSNKKKLTWRTIYETLNSLKKDLIKEEIEPENWDVWLNYLLNFNILRNNCAHGDKISYSELKKVKDFSLNEYGLLWWISAYKQKHNFPKSENQI